MKKLYHSIKILSLLLGFSTLLFISSCGGGDEDAGPTEVDPTDADA